MASTSCAQGSASLFRLLNVPELPPRFSPRDDVMAELQEKVCRGSADFAGLPVVLGAACGGSGKSVAAAAFARSDACRKRVPGGVAWVVFGQAPNILQAQVKVAFSDIGKNRNVGSSVVGDCGSFASFCDEAGGRVCIDALMEGRLLSDSHTQEETDDDGDGADDNNFSAFGDILFIIDDVWNEDDVKRFMTTPLRSKALRELGSRVVITSRSEDMFARSYLGTQNLIKFNSAAIQQSVSLLMAARAFNTDRTMDKSEAEAAKTLVKSCQSSPLALSMLGAMAGHTSPPMSWKHVLQRLQEQMRVQQLHRKRQGVRCVDSDSILAAVMVAVLALPPFLLRKYIVLAATPEDTAIPFQALKLFLDDEEKGPSHISDGGDAVLQLRELNCLRDQGCGMFDVHDVQREVLCMLLSSNAQLTEKDHSLTMADCHVKLLAAYKNVLPSPNAWHLGPNDGYFFQNILEHFVGANMLGDARELAVSLDWLSACLDALRTPSSILIGIHKVFTQIIPVQVEFLISTLISSSHHIANNHKELKFQLAGRANILASASVVPESVNICREAMSSLLETSDCAVVFPITDDLLNRPNGPLKRTLVHHTDWIRGVACTDMQGGPSAFASVLTCSTDGSIVLSNVHSGQVKGQWTPNVKSFTSLEGSQEGNERTEAVTHPIRAATMVPGSVSCGIVGLDDGSVVAFEFTYPDMCGNELIRCADAHTKGTSITCLDISQAMHCVDAAHGRRFIACSGASDGVIVAWVVTLSDKNIISSMVASDAAALHTGEVSGIGIMSLADDNFIVLSGSHDRSLRAWTIVLDPSSLSQPAVYCVANVADAHEAEIRDIAVSSETRVVVSCGDDKRVAVWTLSDDQGRERSVTFRCTHRASLADWVMSVVIVPPPWMGCMGKSQHHLGIVTGSDDGSLCIWCIDVHDFDDDTPRTSETKQLQSFTSIQAHPCGVFGMSLCCGVSCAKQGSPVVADIIDGDPTNIILVTTSLDVRLWDLRQLVAQTHPTLHQTRLRAVAAALHNDCGSRAVISTISTSGEDCNVKFFIQNYDAASGIVVGARVEISSTGLHSDAVLSFTSVLVRGGTFDIDLQESDGKPRNILISSGWDENVIVWRVDVPTVSQSSVSATVIERLVGPDECIVHSLTAAVIPAVLGKDECVCFGGDDDGVVWVWVLGRTETCGQPVMALRGHEGPVLSVSCQVHRLRQDRSTDVGVCFGVSVATGGHDMCVRVWRRGDIDEKTGWKQVDMSNMPADGNVKMTDVKDIYGQAWSSRWQCKVFQGHTGRVLAVHLTQDASRVISASTDTTYGVWDVATGDKIHTLQTNSEFFRRGIAMTGWGNIVVSVSWDGSIRTWTLNCPHGDVATRDDVDSNGAGGHMCRNIVEKRDLGVCGVGTLQQQEPWGHVELAMTDRALTTIATVRNSPLLLLGDTDGGMHVLRCNETCP